MRPPVGNIDWSLEGSPLGTQIDTAYPSPRSHPSPVVQQEGAPSEHTSEHGYIFYQF